MVSINISSFDIQGIRNWCSGSNSNISSTVDNISNCDEINYNYIVIQLVILLLVLVIILIVVNVIFVMTLFMIDDSYNNDT